MNEMIFHYDVSETPSCFEIVKYTVGGTNAENEEFVRSQGEVIIEIHCSDGVVFLVRKGYFSLPALAKRCEQKSVCCGAETRIYNPSANVVQCEACKLVYELP